MQLLSGITIQIIIQLRRNRAVDCTNLLQHFGLGFDDGCQVPKHRKRTTTPEQAMRLGISDLRCDPMKRSGGEDEIKGFIIRCELFKTRADCPEIWAVSVFVFEKINLLLRDFQRGQLKSFPNEIVGGLSRPCADLQNILPLCPIRIGENITKQRVRITGLRRFVVRYDASKYTAVFQWSSFEIHVGGGYRVLLLIDFLYLYAWPLSLFRLTFVQKIVPPSIQMELC